MTQHKIETPVRVGVFGTVAQADLAVKKLFEAGFTHDQIAVICSDETKQRHFGDLFEKPSGSHTPAAASTGGAIGAALGALAMGAGAVLTGGLALIGAGAVILGAGAGAMTGGLIGAMMTRGIEKEAADYYDQAVQEGKILVSVEVEEGPNAEQRLTEAERVFHEAGAEPIALRDG